MMPLYHTAPPKAWHIKLGYMAHVFKIDYVSRQVEISTHPTKDWFDDTDGFAEFKDIIFIHAVGREDLSGQMIYEGDVFDSIYKKDGCRGRYVITFCEDRCIFFPMKIGNHQQPNVSISMNDIVRQEKIGNKFENPDLVLL